MKTVLLIVLRLMFVAVYSISVGILTGYLWLKIGQYIESKRRKADMRLQPAA